MNRSILKLSEHAKLERVALGDEGEPLLKVDNFISDAKALKCLATEKPNFKLEEGFYPGVRMPIHRDYLVAMAKNLGPILSQLFRVDFSRVTSASSRFSMVTLKPEQLRPLQCVPHVDSPLQNSLAIIHYLCDAQDAGTAFYRHVSTGYEYVNQARYTGYMEKVNKSLQAKPRQGYIYQSDEHYRQIAAVGAVFNRALFYRGSSLHSGIIPPQYNFDANPSTGRLTVTSFITFAE